MRFDPLLTKAIRLARRGNFDGAISALEPEEIRYNRSFTYYYLLGLAYLHTGIYNRAYTCFKLAREVRMQEPAVLLALAALYLRRGDTGGAVDFYLDVQEHEPGNRIARRGLTVIRSHAEDINAWLESGQLKKLYPPLPRLPLSLGRLLLPPAAVLAALGISLGILALTGVIPSPYGPPPPRPLAAETLLEKAERDAPVRTAGGSYRYVLTGKEVLDTYEEARTLFTARRDEASRRALNRLLESNASDAVKNKARLMTSYLEAPGFDNLKDHYTYAQVIEEPALYRDCHIIWQGMAANLVNGADLTAFDFLVGYDTRRVMEGIVHVEFSFAIPLNPERPLKVLGRIVPVIREGGEGFRLEGLALNQAGLLTPPAP